MRPPCALQHPRRQRGIRDVAQTPRLPGMGPASGGCGLGRVCPPSGRPGGGPALEAGARAGVAVCVEGSPCARARPQHPLRLPRGPPRAVQGRICLPSLWSPAPPGLGAGLSAGCQDPAARLRAVEGSRPSRGRGPEPAGPLRRHRALFHGRNGFKSQGNCRVRGRWENRPSLLRAVASLRRRR